MEQESIDRYSGTVAPRWHVPPAGNRGLDARLVVGLFAVFACFQWVATALGSDRGQAGLTVGGLVVAATLASERRWFARTVKVLVVSNDSAAPFPLVWMGVAAVLPMLVFLIPRPGSFTPRSV